MAGFWELQRHRVLGGILHVDNVTIAWAFGLRNIQMPGEFIGTAGMPFDMARNEICKHALAGGYSHVFFLDSDVIPPRDAVLRLLAHNLPIVSGVYCRRSPPHGVPVMLKGGQWVTDFPKDSLVEVDLVGAGCLLISCDTLRALPPQSPDKHWFNWKVDQRGKNMSPEPECTSEDFTFNIHARKHGFKTMVDTSIQCRHVGYGEATFNKFVPLEAKPQT
jgi:hypothetical protein